MTKILLYLKRNSSTEDVGISGSELLGLRLSQHGHGLQKVVPEGLGQQGLDLRLCGGLGFRV